MGFETVVLSKVADAVGNSHQAAFTCGTLFVCDVSFAEAEKIKQQLLEIVRGPISVNLVGNEFAFDFE